jgi:hypothetical protein
MPTDEFNEYGWRASRLVWKSGVVLERDGTRAEIIDEYSQRRIRVRVSGADLHGLFANVDEQTGTNSFLVCAIAV